MARTREMYGSEHVAGVLLGDSNLNLAEAEEAAQQTHTGVPLSHSVWHAKAATGQHGGDVMFIKGGNTMVIDLPVGISHADRGVRNDSHDAFGVVLKMHCSPTQTMLDSTATQCTDDLSKIP